MKNPLLFIYEAVLSYCDAVILDKTNFMPLRLSYKKIRPMNTQNLRYTGLLISSMMLFSIFSGSINAQTRTTIGSGDFTDPTIWDCTCIPAATEKIVISDDDSLHIDADSTVKEVRYEYSDNPSWFVVGSGVTFTVSDDFIIEEPNSSDATANVVIEGTMNVGNATGDDIRIFLSNNEDHLTVNFDVQGTLDVAGVLTHASGLNSTFNVINMDVSGTLDIGNITYNFSAADSDLNIDVTGDFNCGIVDVDLTKARSTFSIDAQSGANITTGLINVLSDGNNCDIELIQAAGSTFKRNGTASLALIARGDNSDVDLTISDTLDYYFTNFRGRGDNCTTSVTVNSGGRIVTTTNYRQRNDGTDSQNNFTLNNGGSMSIGSLFDFESSADGTIDFDINGTYSSGNFDFDLQSGTKGTIDFGSTASVTTTNFALNCGGNGHVTFTNNGSFVSQANLDLIALAGDTIISNIKNGTSISSRYWQSTTGNGSRIATTLDGDSLSCDELRMDVNTTATTANNSLTMLTSGSNLTLNRINMDQGARDATIITSENGTVRTTFLGSTTTDIPIRSTVDYDNIRIKNTSAGGVDLNEGDLDTTNFHGDFEIHGSSAKFTVSGVRSMNVQGDFVNQGTYNDNGSDMNVDGSFTTTTGSNFNNDGSRYTIGGTFINGGTFNTTTKSSAIVIGGGFFNSGTFDAEIDTLDIAAGYANSGTYTSTGNNDIYLAGNWSNTGTYTYASGDSVVLDGSSAQTIAGNATIFNLIVDNTNGVSISSGATKVHNQLDVLNGTLTTNGNLTLLSDVDETAYVSDLTGGGSISGNVTVERYLDEGNGWYLLGSPVTGSTLADWNTEMPMSGFTGSDEPTNPWVSVYNYDETTRSGAGFLKETGYVAATNTTNALNSTDGWFVYFQSVKTGITAKTINVTGPLQQGNVNTGTLTLTGSGAAGENGWHIIANPYASPIDWNNLTGDTNIAGGQAYVMGSDGTYKTVNGGDNYQYIYSSEAFWVEITPVFPFPFIGSVTFTEGDKAVVADDYNARTSNPSVLDLPLKLELTYTGKANYLDYSVLSFGNNQNTLAYDASLGEGRKLGNAYGTYPNISSFSYSDTGDVYYNLLSPTDSSLEIPIRIWTQYPSNKTETYTINFDGITDWNKNNKCLVMEDRLNNYSKRLNANDYDYSFSAVDTISEPYIFLNYSIPLDVSSTDATCFAYNDGQASVEGFGSGSHDYLWVDGNNNIVKSEKDITGPSTMNSLAAGEYVVYVSDNGVCGEVAATIHITEPDPVIADFDSDADTVWMNTNSTIFFTNGSINADEYHWDFGDGNTSNSENPAHTYTSGGTYNVSLVAITGPCSDTLNKTVMVVDNVGIKDDLLSQFKDPINIYQYNNETFIEFNFNEATDAVVNMFDVLGRNTIEPLKINRVKSRTVKLDVPNNLMGVYTISVIANDKKEAKKIYYTRR